MLAEAGGLRVRGRDHKPLDLLLLRRRDHARLRPVRRVRPVRLASTVPPVAQQLHVL